MKPSPFLPRGIAALLLALLLAACSSRPPPVAAPAPAPAAAASQVPGAPPAMCVREGDSCVAPGSACCAGLVCVGFRNSFCAPKP
jgi:hypothetical protein